VRPRPFNLFRLARRLRRRIAVSTQRRWRALHERAVAVYGRVPRDWIWHAPHLAIGVFAIAMLVSSTAGAKRLPPTYTVRLIAAPAADLEARKAPEAFERPAEEKPAPVAAPKTPRSTVSRATPPPTREAWRRHTATFGAARNPPRKQG